MTEEEIRAQREQCADCGGALQEIKVRQNGHLNVVMPLVYLDRDAEESNWMGGANLGAVEGTLLAFMCLSCARVYFYGAAKPHKISGSKKTPDR